MANREIGRLAAHVLLDAVSTYDSSAPEDESGDILDLAVARLADVDCVTVAYNDETSVATVDATDLVGGTVVLLNALVERLVLETGIERALLVSQTREIIDQSL
ncbi:hypothetical protein [Micromonospora carbonacea]|uniref:Uncharacterized protein n=1 Tax=Micromonospora carbonacea TaxID=47853 RepID=A0A7H8XHH5_9ACTN|nr:hypothetical protein [Micromonospora carbonacea]MBB5828150.1 hypothetical protein [Micromonospora carbonacea]QLD24205.1 hypothetical protein HXZ27_08240 [Micromonospora carbonacea]